jgi:hypothetical protein
VTQALLLAAFLLAIGTLVWLLKMIWDHTKRKAGFWGINFGPVNCPKCGRRTPLVRKPTSVTQALWGGWTCSQCGTEMDKWGTDITSSLETSVGQTERLNEGLGGFYSDKRHRSPVERIIEEDNSETNEH